MGLSPFLALGVSLSIFHHERYFHYCFFPGEFEQYDDPRAPDLFFFVIRFFLICHRPENAVPPPSSCLT